jgi:hypothetical protein
LNSQHLSQILAPSISHSSLESAPICRDNSTLLAGEETYSDVTEYLEALPRTRVRGGMQVRGYSAYNHFFCPKNSDPALITNPPSVQTVSGDHHRDSQATAVRVSGSGPKMVAVLVLELFERSGNASIENPIRFPRNIKSMGCDKKTCIRISVIYRVSHVKCSTGQSHN